MIYRYIEDFFYMAMVRSEINDKISLDKMWGGNIHALNEHKQQVESYARERIKETIAPYQLELISSFEDIRCTFVWNRTFETKVEVKWLKF